MLRGAVPAMGICLIGVNAAVLGVMHMQYGWDRRSLCFKHPTMAKSLDTIRYKNKKVFIARPSYTKRPCVA